MLNDSGKISRYDFRNVSNLDCVREKRRLREFTGREQGLLSLIFSKAERFGFLYRPVIGVDQKGAVISASVRSNAYQVIAGNSAEPVIINRSATKSGLISVHKTFDPQTLYDTVYEYEYPGCERVCFSDVWGLACQAWRDVSRMVQSGRQEISALRQKVALDRKFDAIRRRSISLIYSDE